MITNCSEVRNQFNVTINDDDGVLLPLIHAAQKYAENYCDTIIEAADVTEYQDGDGTDTVLLRNFPVNSITSVYDDVGRDYAAASLIPAASYMFESSGRLILENALFSFGRQNVKVVYNAGYADVPDDIKVAVANITFANYLEANGSINMVEGQEIVYRPAKLRSEALRILDLYKKMG